MRRRQLTRGLVGFLLATGCRTPVKDGVAPATVMGPPQKGVGSTTVVVQLSEITIPRHRRSRAERDAALLALGIARARWAASGTDAYEYRLTHICFCWLLFGNPTVIEVRHGVAGPVRDTLGLAQPRAHGQTVEEWFAQIESAIEGDAERVTVSYDAALGYPTEFEIDPEITTSDDEFRVTLSRLVALPPGSRPDTSQGARRGRPRSRTG